MPDSFMYANCYGTEGVQKLIQILKTEIVHDGAQAGVTDLKKVPRALVSPSSSFTEFLIHRLTVGRSTLAPWRPVSFSWTSNRPPRYKGGRV